MSISSSGARHGTVGGIDMGFSSGDGGRLRPLLVVGEVEVAVDAAISQSLSIAVFKTGAFGTEKG